MAKFNIIKTFHFDAGHRIWNHDLTKGRGSDFFKDKDDPKIEKIRTKCSNPHGHTFHIEIHFEGNNLDEQGMIVDTDVIKLLIRDAEEIFDHSYILHQDDPLKNKFLEMFEGYKVVVIDVMPTAEGIAKCLYRFFEERIKPFRINTFHLRKVVVKVSDSIIGSYEEDLNDF